MKKLIITFLVLTISFSSFSQSTWFTTSFSVDKNLSSWDRNGISFGFGVEHKFDKNLGITGIIEGFTSYVLDDGYELDYISIPVGLKFYTNWLNFEAGPALTMGMGWRNNNLNNNIAKVSMRDLGFDFRGKVSHSFPISDRLEFEPGIIVRFFDWDWYTGVSLELKIGK